MPYPEAEEAFKLAPYPKELDLKFVEIVHRHGERTPISKTGSSIFKGWEGKCTLTPFLHTIYSFRESFAHDSESFPEKESLPPNLGNGVSVPSVSPMIEVPKNGSSDISTLVSGSNDLMTIKHLKQVIGDGSCFLGQLTDIGKRTMQSIGENLRKVYLDKLELLPKDPITGKANYSDHVYVRSTDYARTIESVQYLLSGLNSGYSLSFDDKAFKIHIREAQYETMYPHPACKRLNALTKEFREANYLLLKPTVTKIMSDLQPIFPEIPTTSKFKESPMLLLHAIYDGAISAKAHGLEVPALISDKYLRMMEDITVRMWWTAFAATPFTNSLSLGRFLPELYGKMKSVVDGESDLKMAIFSGHDSTIAPLLFAFHAFDGKYPKFASLINIELFEDKEKRNEETIAKSDEIVKSKNSASHFVRVLYNGEPLILPHCAKQGNHYKGKLEGIKDNKYFCTLDAFADIVNTYGSGFTKKEVKAGDWDWYQKQCKIDGDIKSDWDDSGL